MEFIEDQDIRYGVYQQFVNKYGLSEGSYRFLSVWREHGNEIIADVRAKREAK